MCVTIIKPSFFYTLRLLITVNFAARPNPGRASYDVLPEKQCSCQAVILQLAGREGVNDIKVYLLIYLKKIFFFSPFCFGWSILLEAVPALAFGGVPITAIFHPKEGRVLSGRHTASIYYTCYYEMVFYISAELTMSILYIITKYLFYRL